MSGYLCLKWNNHSSAFINQINRIQFKEKYCDATIACQGKFFSVHRIILSTCSDYFGDIFDRMQCQHPYIVFKDIEAREMELLLNYMYQGEINVLQENLPLLIKAAEALKIKGLAVPDDVSSDRDLHTEKKKNNSSQSEIVGKKKEDRKKSVISEGDMSNNISSTNDSSSYQPPNTNTLENNIKEEPLELIDYENTTDRVNTSVASNISESQSYQNESIFSSTNKTGDSNVKNEDPSTSEMTYLEQPSLWTDYGSTNIIENHPSSENILQNDIYGEVMRGTESVTVYERTDGPSKVLQKPSKPNTLLSSIRDRRFLHRCSFCNYESYSKTSVQVHTRFKHTKEKPFHCSFCPQRFTTKLILDRHVRTHTGEKPFKCDICGFRFIQKISLKKHLRTHSR